MGEGASLCLGVSRGDGQPGDPAAALGGRAPVVPPADDDDGLRRALRAPDLPRRRGGFAAS